MFLWYIEYDLKDKKIVVVFFVFRATVGHKERMKSGKCLNLSRSEWALGLFEFILVNLHFLIVTLILQNAPQSEWNTCNDL